MHIFGYVVIGFLIVCMLLAATKALSVANAMMIAVADMAQVVAPETTQSPRQPTPGPILQQQNQTDRATAIAKTRRRGGGLTKHAGLGSPRFGSFAVQPQGGCNERPLSPLMRRFQQLPPLPKSPGAC
jgi:hypothetical protein